MSLFISNFFREQLKTLFMKHYLSLILVSLFFAGGSAILAQSYNVNNIAPVYTCSGSVYDRGGATGTYTNATRTDSLTIYPTVAGLNAIKLTFTEFSIGALDGFDVLEIFDGPTTNSPVIRQAYTLINAIPVGYTVTSSHPTGAITLKFSTTYNASYPLLGSKSAGFAANISCAPKNIAMNIAGTTKDTVCEASFYDNGNRLGAHSGSANGTKTFYPSTPGQGIKLDLSSLNLYADAYLSIYDGEDTNAPLLAKYSYDLLNPNLSGISHTASESNTTGAITVHFQSAGNLEGRPGWEGTISCATKTPIQHIAMSNNTFTVCNAKIYDSGGPLGQYHNNENLILTLYPADNTKALSLKVEDMDLDYNLGDLLSAADRLIIYDGPSITDARAITFQGNVGANTTIVSTHPTGALTLNFISDGIERDPGFELTASCVTKEYRMPRTGTVDLTLCEGKIYDSGGEHLNHSQNEDGTFIIRPATPTQGIKLQFIDFELGSNDYLYIYDGDNSSAPLLGKFHTDNSPEIIKATSNNNTGALTLHFVSDDPLVGNTTGLGWAANISCDTKGAPYYALNNGTVTVCNAKIYDSGGPNGKYSNNENIVMTFYPADSSKALEVSFVNFMLGTGDLFDTLKIYDGPSTSNDLAIQLTSLNQNSPIPNITSTHSSGALTFYFSSNIAVNESGWEANLSCVTKNYKVPASSSNSITTCEGVLFDNGGQHLDYSNNADGYTTIYPAVSGEGVELTFTNINLSSNDRIYIYDGINPNAPLIVTYEGGLTNSINLPIVHKASSANSTGALTVRLRSNGDFINSDGFRATISCSSKGIPTYSMANDTLEICEGKIYDSGGPASDYANLEDVVLTLKPATPGKAVRLTFDDFDLDLNIISLLTDKLEVFDGPNTSSPEVITLIGNNLPAPITSTHPSGMLTLRFISNLIDTDLGFEITTSCVDRNYRMPISGIDTIITCTGTLFDDGGEFQNYSNNVNSTIVIYPENPTDGVSLTFNEFKTDGIISETADDILYIYDGDSENAPLIGRYYHTDIPGTVTASVNNATGALTVKFISSTFINHEGWSADITCTSTKNSTPRYVMNNDTIYMCEGTIYDSGGPNAHYFNGENYTLVICPNTPESRISLDFETFRLQNPNIISYIDDALYVYDGIGATSPLIDMYTTGVIGYNENSPVGLGPITAGLNNTSGCLTLNFKSDLTLVDSGFIAKVKCEPGCSPISVAMNITSHIEDPTSNLYQICNGDTLVANVISPDPSLVYTWTLGDGTEIIGDAIAHLYNTSGIYPIGLKAENALGCKGGAAQKYVLAVAKPIFTTSAQPDTACINNEIILTASVVGNNNYTNNCDATSLDTIAISESGSLSQYVSINCYAPGSTITNASDFELCMSIDHQKMGDLDIELTCPSGQSIKILKPKVTNARPLGVPLGYIGGLNYTYCFNSNETVLLRDGKDLANLAIGIVESGSFKSEEAFENLIGCPVNGDWELRIRDLNSNLLIGHSRGWSLNFNNGGFTSNAAIIAAAQQTITSTNWETVPGLTITSDTSATAIIQNLGANQYVFTATDNFGCVHTSDTVNVIGTQGALVSITGPSEICQGDTLTLTAIGGANAQYLWSTGATTATMSTLPASGASAIYTVTVTLPNQTCQGIANHTVALAAKPNINLSSIPPVVVCMGDSALIYASASNINNILWSTSGNGIFTYVSGDTVKYAPGTADEATSLATITAIGIPQNAVCEADTAIYMLTIHIPTVNPTPDLISGIHCPNTDIQLAVQGTIQGTNSRLYWYEDSTATNLIDSNAAITVAPLMTKTYYVKAKNACSESDLVPVTVTVRDYIYGDHEVNTNQYCKDNDGWHHFYLPSNNKIILSVQGDFTLQAPGYPIARLHYKTDSTTLLSASHQHPLVTPDCNAIDSTTREYTFELSRSWEVNTQGSLAGLYNVRFYYDAADKDSLIALANNFINNHLDCDYQPIMQLNSEGSGFYWYKTDNDTMTYTVPTFGKFCAGINHIGTGLTPNQVHYAEFDGITKFSIGSGGITVAAINPLPIKLLSFTGERDNNVNNLYWSTATETENSHFNIQRSADGLNFTTIGVVAGSGNSLNTIDYKFIDIAPLFGINYYRLEDVSITGKTSYSNVIALDKAGMVKENSRFFPNPTQTSVTYEFTTLESDRVSIEVLNMLGQRIISTQHEVTPGMNQIYIDLSQYPSGTYLINTKHENANEKQTERIIKIN